MLGAELEPVAVTRTCSSTHWREQDEQSKNPIHSSTSGWPLLPRACQTLMRYHQFQRLNRLRKSPSQSRRPKRRSRASHKSPPKYKSARVDGSQYVVLMFVQRDRRPDMIIDIRNLGGTQAEEPSGAGRLQRTTDRVYQAIRSHDQAARGSAPKSTAKPQVSC